MSEWAATRSTHSAPIPHTLHPLPHTLTLEYTAVFICVSWPGRALQGAEQPDKCLPLYPFIIFADTGVCVWSAVSTAGKGDLFSQDEFSVLTIRGVRATAGGLPEERCDMMCAILPYHVPSGGSSRLYCAARETRCVYDSSSSCPGIYLHGVGGRR